MKTIICLITILSVFLCSGCSGLGNGIVSKEDVFSFVEENIEKLESIPIESVPEDRNEQVKFLEKYFGKKTIIKSIYSDFGYDWKVVRFYCGGAGNATGSTYVGFIFSEDDKPISPLYDETLLTEISPGVFEWKDDAGLHTSHIEKIRDCWYYYIEECY